MRVVVGLLAAAVSVCAFPARADVVARTAPAAGSVIARKAGEEVRFIDVSSWQSVDVSQDLLAGDVLRTNALGNLAVLFSDRTQMRLGRNTTMLVKAVGAVSDSRFALQAGTMWGRAERGGAGLTIDTPAAAAAIRGTDWTLTVGADGETSLIVLEGLVELSNEFGSVRVAQGEAARARIGEAPSKIIVVAPVDREQMLFHLSLKDSFDLLPPNPGSVAEMRRDRTRIRDLPPARRSAEDLVTLAEVSLPFDGTAAARQAVAEARGRDLTAAQQARLMLVEALIAGDEQRYEAAAALFERAAPRLDARRSAMALYGGYYARALAEPSRAETPPALGDTGPYAALAQAWTAGFLEDVPAALERVEKALERYPDDTTLLAARAQFAMLLDRRDVVEESVARALAIDPDDPMALQARATYRADIKGDLEGAYADLVRAAELAPGGSGIWNTLGLVQRGRDAEREAEAALLKAVEFSPNDPVYLINLAFLYLDQDRNAEAKALIDQVLETDPSYDVALVARGRYHLQTGDIDKGRDDLLAGTTANPAHAQGLLLLSGAYYEGDDRQASDQAIENADRLDPNDPVTTSFMTAIAIDAYDADAAIRAAQETLRRTRARGGDFAALSANKDAGSTLNNAYRLAGLDAWGQYYGQAVFDPFSATGYFDQAISGSAVPYVTQMNAGSATADPTANGDNFSALMQGLLLDPAAISGRSRSANLLRRPFNEGSIGGGFVSTPSDVGWTTSAELQGFMLEPIPWSYYAQFDGIGIDDRRFGFPLGGGQPNYGFTLGDETFSGVGYLTARPTPYDRVVAFANVQRDTDRLADGFFIPDPATGITLVQSDRRLSSLAGTGGVAWSHTFGHRNVMNAGVFYTEASGDGLSVREDFAPGASLRVDTITETARRSYLGAVGHSLGYGDVTIRYGAEVGEARTDDYGRIVTTLTVAGIPPIVIDVDNLDRTSSLLTRGHLDLLWEPTPTLSVEAGIFPTALSGDIDVARLDPRLALGWSPVENHWLRAGFISRTEVVSEATLAPIGVLGLQANQTPLAVGGRVDTAMARWDAEWTDRLFTTFEYQHQDIRDASIPIPTSVNTIALSDARLGRVSGTANVWLGYGFGATATFAYTQSRNRDPASAGFGIGVPFVPELSGRIGLTWVNPANVKATLAATYIGERESELPGNRLGDFWTLDASLTWEPFDKRFALELGAFNLLDEDFEIGRQTPGWGRTFTGSLKVRF